MNNLFSFVLPAFVFMLVFGTNQPLTLTRCAEDDCTAVSAKQLVAEIEGEALIYRVTDGAENEVVEVYAFDKTGEAYRALRVPVQVLRAYADVAEDTPITVSQEVGLYKLESDEYQLHIMDNEQETISVTLESLTVGAEYQIEIVNS